MLLSVSLSLLQLFDFPSEQAVKPRASRSRVFQGTGISALATKPEVSRNRSRRQEPPLDRSVLNMEFKREKKKPHPQPISLHLQPMDGDGTKAKQALPRQCWGPARRGRGWCLWQGMGSGTPADGRERGAGSERAGSERDAMDKQVTRIPATAQPCRG